MSVVHALLVDDAVRSSPAWRELCPPTGLDSGGQSRLNALSTERRCVARGKALFCNGDHLASLYEVHSGQFKTCVSTEAGHHQVTGFKMNGELLGLDGIGSGRHGLDAVALEDSQVWLMAYDGLNELLQEFAALQHQFHRIMSREIVRSHALMLVLGSLCAEGRVAAFLVDLTQRLGDRGFSTSSVILRMSREEIGSYLGLKLETVSRAFSKLHGDGVLDVKYRHVRVVDAPALRCIAHRQGCRLAGE